jgi:hypothetical protein
MPNGEAARSSEVTAYIYQTTRRLILEYSNLTTLKVLNSWDTTFWRQWILILRSCRMWCCVVRQTFVTSVRHPSSSVPALFPFCVSFYLSLFSLFSFVKSSRFLWWTCTVGVCCVCLCFLRFLQMIYFHEIWVRSMPIPVAARSKPWVCGRSLAAISGSNPAESMGVCLLSVSCIVS